MENRAKKLEYLIETADKGIVTSEELAAIIESLVKVMSGIKKDSDLSIKKLENYITQIKEISEQKDFSSKLGLEQVSDNFSMIKKELLETILKVKEEIVSQIPIIPEITQQEIKTPIKGIDYFTDEDKNEISLIALSQHPFNSFESVKNAVGFEELKKSIDETRNIAVSNAHQLYTGISETRVRELINTLTPTSSGGGIWGSIMGTLSNQTDLQTVLNAKQGTISLTTTGTSGAATFIGNTLNIPQYSGSGMVYPGAGIAVSTGSTWAISITDNSTNWNTAFTQTRQWDGGSTGLVAATGRTSLGLGTLATQSGTFSGTSSGTNTGDNAVNSLYSGLVSNATHTGDATGATALTVVAINGTNMATLGTGIIKNTTGTGVPSIAIAADFPTLNQNTSGSAATLTTSRNIQGIAFNGSAAIDIINGTGFVKATGTTLSYDNSTYLTTASAASTYQPLDSDLTTIAGLTATTDNFIQSKGSAWSSRTPTQVTADLIAFVGDSGSGGTKGLVPAPTTGDATKFLKGNGTWTAIPGGGDALVANPLSQFASTTSLQLLGVMSDETGTGALVFANTPTLVTPILGTPTSVTLTNATGLPIAGLVASTSTAIGVGSIELGNASDTTITRVSAGVIAVEGATVLTTTSISDTAYASSWDGVTTVAPSKNAVYDQMEVDVKQDYLNIFKTLGSAIVALPPAGTVVTTNRALTSGTIQYTPIWIKRSMTITGVKFVMSTQGAYTASNYNGFGLYSYSGGTLTLVASSTNDGTIWKAATGTFSSKAFTSTYAASPGLYFVAALYSQSAVTSGPTVGANPLPSSSSFIAFDFANSAKLFALLAAQTALPSSSAMSSLAASFENMWFALY